MAVKVMVTVSVDAEVKVVEEVVGLAKVVVVKVVVMKVAW